MRTEAELGDAFIRHMRNIGAILDGHFLYASGRHGVKYLNKDMLSLHPVELRDFLEELCEKIDPSVDVIVAPVIGAVIPATHLSYLLSKRWHRNIPLCYAEKIPGELGFLLKRGFDKAVLGARALLVEDILTTGGSVNRVIPAIEENGGKVIQIVGLINRNPKEVDSSTFGGIPLVTLAEIQLDSWNPSECPSCLAGIPMSTNLGHAKKAATS